MNTLKVSHLHYIILLMLLSIFTCRCIIEWLFPFYLGFPIGSTILVAIGILCSMYSLYYSYKTYRFGNKYLILIFIIYTSFVYYDLFISPEININQMLGVPKNQFDFAKETITILLTMLSATLCLKKMNYRSFSIITIVIISVFLFIYFSYQPYTIYRMTAEVARVERDKLVSEGYIDGFTIGNYIGLLFACNLYMSDKWTSKRVISSLISLFIGILCLIIQFLVFQRGPFLFLLTTLLFYSYAKGYISIRYLWLISLGLLFLIVFADNIFTLLNSISSSSLKRYDNIFSSGGTGRWGSRDSEYALSINQILESPFFGSYPRTLAVARIGHYPHNFLLELLMTFGILFTIPMIVLLWRAVKRSFLIIKHNRNESLFAIWFIYIFSCLFTSGSIMCHTSFWFTFVAVLSTQDVKFDRNIKLRRFFSDRYKITI